jgi:hypothetical protein
MGCGGGTSSHPSGPVLSGNTSITLFVSSTANDQLTQFNLYFTSLTLTSQSGKTVSLLTTTQGAEFMHLNGNAEPLLTTTVPQDIYTAATATIGNASFVCVNQVAGGLYNNTFAYGDTPSSQVSVNLATPVTVTGTAMGIALDLQVSESATYGSCDPMGIDPYSINPTLNLTPVTFTSQPTNTGNGEGTGLDGFIASVNAAANSFTVTAADGPSWTVNSTSDTAFQGVAGFSALSVGMPVDIDIASQTNGSLQARRVEVVDANPTNLSVSTGPLESVAGSEPALLTDGREEQGFLYTPNKVSGSQYFSFGNAKFQISGQFTNLKSLPFTASFDSANMVAGQNVLITSHALTFSGGPTYVPAATMTLLPQTINGTVTAVSSEGGFDAYTVALASYDLFPDLAVQPGQTTLLSNPGTVVVYVDSNAQLLNSSPVVAGSVLRFKGLLFNDKGTLKMDCAQVNDGVTE